MNDEKTNKFQKNIAIITLIIHINRNRNFSKKEIMIILIIGGIESNPGPEIETVKVITINCNGLTSDQRLLQAIGRLKKKIKTSTAVIFLQETHNTNIILLENIWRGNVNISSGTGGSKGVVTLSTDNLEVLSFESDTEGKFLFTTLRVGSNGICHTANIYAPNNHNSSKNFFNNAFQQWDQYIDQYAHDFGSNNEHVHYILAGDLNCVIHESDAQNRNRTKAEKDLAEDLVSYAEDRGLFDSVLKSSNGNNYTWNRGNTFSKIDYIFVSDDMLYGIKKYETVWDLVKSDHAAICLDIAFNKTRNKGRSYPKLSSLDIANKSDCNEIRNEIRKAIEEFPVHWNPHQKLEYIKVVLRTVTLEIRARNKITETQLGILKEELEQFNKLDFLDKNQTKIFNDLRASIYTEEEKQAEKLRMLAGVRWREEGERSTKYFLNIAKSREAMATLDYLQTEYGRLENTEDIMTYTRSFYKNLYDKRDKRIEPDFFRHCPRISQQAAVDLDKDITLEDLKEALKTCKDSTPGMDGIPYCFYRAFMSELLPIVLNAWNYSQVTKTLPQSQLSSCISLIPKVGKDKHEIKNWRPISLSTCDLKIITKSMSLKIGKYLSEIIHDSQMGYVPGRDINFNNRILKTALNMCRERGIDYTLTSLDAQKAYDSVSHTYISEALEAYSFPTSFINKVNLLHTNLKAVVQINGHLSEAFKIERGVKQGDALSCALFIIAIDPLLRNINENVLIPPIKLASGCIVKTLAYADDIAVITANEDEAANALFYEYDRLTKCSGLTLNAEKTEILNLSKFGKVKTLVHYDNNSLELEHCEAVTICGNYLCRDDNKSYEKNVLDKIVKLENQLNRWKGRNLSLNGKMIIIKTFAISQLIFSCQFQALRPKDIRKIEHVIYTFAWNGRDRVRRSILKSERHNGGINGIDVDSFFRAIAVRQFFKSNSDPRLQVINKCYVVREDIKLIARNTMRSLLSRQLESNENEWVWTTPVSLFVKTYSKSHKLMEDMGFTTVSSISFETMTRQIANRVRKCLMPALLLIIDQESSGNDLTPQICLRYENKLHNLSKIKSRVLNFIIKENMNKITPYHPEERYKINRMYFGDICSTWHNLWMIKNPTLRSIRHKIIYKDVWTNEKRYKLNIAKDDKCVICGEIETVFHQLFTCKNAIRFWKILLELTGTCLPSNEEQFALFIAVSGDYLTETIKSCIFKLLIQIDRSCEITHVQLLRYLTYWLKIECMCISKMYKNNNSQMRRLTNALTYLSSGQRR